jgi:hypothetical protein
VKDLAGRTVVVEPLESAPSPTSLADEAVNDNGKAADEAVNENGKAVDEAVNEAALVLQLEDGELTLFEAAIGAFNAGEFDRAESLFLEEAEAALPDSPQRAAIAFREAALAARRAGNLDGSDHWMRLAGREYLRVSEDPRTPLPFIREAAVMAAKCFLSVENLHIASKGLRRAQAIESVLSTDEDLMAGSFAAGWSATPPPTPEVAPIATDRAAARARTAAPGALRAPGRGGEGSGAPDGTLGRGGPVYGERSVPEGTTGRERSPRSQYPEGEYGRDGRDGGDGRDGAVPREDPGQRRTPPHRGRAAFTRRRRPGLPRRR